MVMKGKVIGIVVEPAQHEKLRKESFTRRVSISSIVRQALDEYWKRQEQGK